MEHLMPIRLLLHPICAALLLAFTALTTVGCNPNYCADRENNDCRSPLLPEPECAASTDCMGKPDQGDKLVCDVDNSVCVQCTTSEASACSGKTPVCAGTACIACKEHSSCVSGACLPDGSCGTDENVAYVAPAALGTAASVSCTKAAPCSKVSEAIATGREFVKISGTIVENVTIDNKNVKFIAAPGAQLKPQVPGPVLEVKGSSQVEINDLEITGGIEDNGAGLLMSGNASSSVSLLRSKLTNNGGGGLLGRIGMLRVFQSRLIGNSGGGISINRSSFDISNNLIAMNGTSSSTLGGVDFGNISSMGNKFEFNTVASNTCSPGLIAGVNCSQVSFAISLANNIVYANNALVRDAVQISGTNCPPTFSNIGPTSMTGLGNINTDPLFVDVRKNDFHLQATSMAKDAADPKATQTTDIDNQPRDVRRDMGADEVM
jgi:hypothetical protein